MLFGHKVKGYQVMFDNGRCLETPDWLREGCDYRCVAPEDMPKVLALFEQNRKNIDLHLQAVPLFAEPVTHALGEWLDYESIMFSPDRRQEAFERMLFAHGFALSRGYFRTPDGAHVYAKAIVMDYSEPVRLSKEAQTFHRVSHLFMSNKGVLSWATRRNSKTGRTLPLKNLVSVRYEY